MLIQQAFYSLSFLVLLSSAEFAFVAEAEHKQPKSTHSKSNKKSKGLPVSIPSASHPPLFAQPHQGSAKTPAHGYTCKDAIIPVEVSLFTTDLSIVAPRTQSELTGMITLLASTTGPHNVTDSFVRGQAKLETAYDIWGQICAPVGFKTKGVLEFVVHGHNYDHQYWQAGGTGSKYNYVESAMQSGHAVFMYDRLGVGRSEKPDGIKEIQTSTEIAMAGSLLLYLRKGGFMGFTFGKIIGIGHSYGSVKLLGVASLYGNLMDAIILTGFAASTGSYRAALSGMNLKLAAKQNPSRWAALEDNSFLVLDGIYNHQMVFFHPPYFDFALLETMEHIKETITLGELFTQTEPLQYQAVEFKGSVMVISGSHDFVWCGGNCYQRSEDPPIHDLLQPVKSLFPNARRFSTYIVPLTGNAINLHLSAPESFQVMQNWMAGL